MVVAKSARGIVRWCLRPSATLRLAMGEKVSATNGVSLKRARCIALSLCAILVLSCLRAHASDQTANLSEVDLESLRSAQAIDSSESLPLADEHAARRFLANHPLPTRAVLPECGPNALFFLLNLCQAPATLDQVRSLVELGQHGASLEELRRVAVQLGLAVRVMKCSPVALSGREPLIALQGDPSPGGGGHYVVVLRRGDQGRATTIDGTTGELRRLPPGSFDRDFSGFALIPADHGPTALESGWVTIALMGVVVGECALLIRFWRRA